MLVQKLLNHNIPDSGLDSDYLTDRSQYVRITSKRTLSHCLQSNKQFLLHFYLPCILLQI